MRLTSLSPQDTAAVGRILGRACRGGELILLEGELGAGKTTLAQGIAAGLGVKASVVSPTFVLLREYQGRLPLYHFDFYRLEGTCRDVDLEFDDYLTGDGVCVVEWPRFVPGFVSRNHLQIKLTAHGPDRREIELNGVGSPQWDLLSPLAGQFLDATAAP